MIAQHIDYTRDFLKASRIRDYAQLKKMCNYSASRLKFG